MNKTSDVIIIGAGIMGCSAAYYLAKRGVNVTVLERGEVACGASGRNGSGVRQSGRDAREMPLALYGVRNIWPYLSEELEADIEYEQVGNMRVGLTDADRAALEKLVSTSQSRGLPDIHMISVEEAKERNPLLSDEIVCASFCPSDGRSNPMRTTLAYYKKALAYGAKFVIGTTVLSLKKQQGRIRQVITTNGIYEADTVILCAGQPSRDIMHSVGLTVPICEKYCEVVITEPIKKTFAPFTGCVHDFWYAAPQANGSILVGCMTPYLNYDADYGKEVNTTPIIPWNIQSLLRYMPALRDVKIIRAWSGSLDKCWDEVPILSRVSEVPGLILACGFSGHGFAIGPAVGYTLSQMTMNEETTVAIDGLRYDRFAIPHKH